MNQKVRAAKRWIEKRRDRDKNLMDFKINTSNPEKSKREFHLRNSRTITVNGETLTRCFNLELSTSDKGLMATVDRFVTDELNRVVLTECKSNLKTESRTFLLMSAQKEILDAAEELILNDLG